VTAITDRPFVLVILGQTLVSMRQAAGSEQESEFLQPSASQNR